MKVRIEKFTRFQYPGGRGVAIEGRSEEKKYRTLAAFGPVGEAMAREMTKIAGGVDQLSDIHERKIVVEVEGEWRTRMVKGKAKPDFQISSFTFLSGPSAELFRARSKACEVSAQAGKLHAEGRYEEAYLLLEEYVAMFGMVPIPSLDGVEPEAVPEASPVDEADGIPTAEAGVDPEAGALGRFGAVEPEAVVSDGTSPKTALAEVEERLGWIEDTVRTVFADMGIEETGTDADAASGPKVVEVADAGGEALENPPLEDPSASDPAADSESGVSGAAPAPEPAKTVAAPKPAASAVAQTAPKVGGFRPGMGGFKSGGIGGFRPGAPKKDVQPEAEPEAEGPALRF